MDEEREGGRGEGGKEGRKERWEDGRMMDGRMGEEMFKHLSPAGLQGDR